MKKSFITLGSGCFVALSVFLIRYRSRSHVHFLVALFLFYFYCDDCHHDLMSFFYFDHHHQLVAFLYFELCHNLLRSLSYCFTFWHLCGLSIFSTSSGVFCFHFVGYHQQVAICSFLHLPTTSGFLYLDIFFQRVSSVFFWLQLVAWIYFDICINICDIFSSR